MYVDNVKVRKYTHPEPSLKVGNEEEPANQLPPGVVCYFNPLSCLPTCASILNISTSSTTPPGTYTIVIVGVGNEIIRTTRYQLNVLPSPSTGPPPPGPPPPGPVGRYVIYPKWNLISSVFKKVTNVVFDQCDLKSKKLYYLNRTIEKWEEKTWTELEGGKGYWIFSEASRPCEITLSGTGEVTISDIPPLKKEYNIIGAPSTSVLFSSIIGGCSGKIDEEIGLLYWNASLQKWVKSDWLVPTNGYWIYAKDNCNLG
jgi:hypothetical protein